MNKKLNTAYKDGSRESSSAYTKAKHCYKDEVEKLHRRK
jgi:hypothetical protein